MFLGRYGSAIHAHEPPTTAATLSHNLSKYAFARLEWMLLGFPAPPCADRGCTDSCSTEG